MLCWIMGSMVSICQTPLQFDTWSVVKNQKQFIGLQNKHHLLLVFLSPECPLCQNYSIQLNQLATEFGDKLTIYGVIPGTAYPPEQVRRFKNDFNFSFDLVIDSNFATSNYFNASVTPEAVLITPSGKKVYSGAIDNWVVALGKKRGKPTAHYVKEALTQSLAHLPITLSDVPAVGCTINDY